MIKEQQPEISQAKQKWMTPEIRKIEAGSAKDAVGNGADALNPS